jgi:SNF2 family DNA or RNA helicase
VFRTAFLAPIDNGQSCGWDRLRSLIRAISLRRTKPSLQSELNLPSRRDVICRVHLDGEERSLYNLVKRYFKLSIHSGRSEANAFQLVLRLRQVSNHGRDLLPRRLQEWLDQAYSFEDVMPPQFRLCEFCNSPLPDEHESTRQALSCFHQVCLRCLRILGTPRFSTKAICPLCDSDTAEINGNTDTVVNLAIDVSASSYRPSSKVKALLQNLGKVAKLTHGGAPAKRSVIQRLLMTSH